MALSGIACSICRRRLFQTCKFWRCT